MPQRDEDNLVVLKDKILKMGALVEAQLADAMKSLVETDLTLARKTIQNDHIVNEMDEAIDEECIRLLTQSTAGDLRFITTAMKIATDLERISDLSKDICEKAIELFHEPLLKPYIDLPRMAEAARKMIREVLDAFVNRDAELARKVCADHAFLNNLNDHIFRELLAYMVEDSGTITRAIQISFISKYIERMGECTTDVAETVIYLVEGKNASPN
ncbi:MAG: phosphate signaling complex protein PhoU [Nitrospiria bacterium]